MRMPLEASAASAPLGILRRGAGSTWLTAGAAPQKPTTFWITPRGFPQQGTASRNRMGCRYHNPGELGRSLLKERYLYEDARFNTLARWHGQIPAQLVLPARDGVGNGGNAARRSDAAAGRHAVAPSPPASSGRQCDFTLPSGGWSATVAFRTGAAAGSVDASCDGRTAPAGRDRGDGRHEHCFRPVCDAVSGLRGRCSRSAANVASRFRPDSGGSAGQGTGKKGSARSVA